MINYIKGTLSEIENGLIVVEANGVGYEIFVPSTLISNLPPKGSDVKIYTYFSVKEDSQSLYGFFYKEDREIFTKLIGVNGVGPKAALAILSIMGSDELRMAIITGDAKSISLAPGVGRKTSERIILDLRDKISGMDLAGKMSKVPESSLGVSFSGADGPVTLALEALSSLGYSRIEAARMLSRFDIKENMSTEDILRAALKNINI